MEIPLNNIACFYLTQPLSVTEHENKKEGKGNSSWIIGEFISDCRVNAGNPGILPDDSDQYKIVLYKDPDSEDS